MPSYAGVLSCILQMSFRISDNWCFFSCLKEGKQIRSWKSLHLSVEPRVPGARRGISTAGKVGHWPAFLFNKLHWSEVLPRGS